MNMQDDPGGVMVFNTTFNIISVISWQSVLVEESSVLGEATHWQTLSHKILSSTIDVSRLNASGDGHLLHW
jgi:hypothetical protein